MNCIVDYGVGNIEAYLSLTARVGVPLKRTSSPSDLRLATRLIFPGVGHFDSAMRKLHQSGLRDELEAAVLGRMVPILGVCVGMQMFSDGSDEGVIPGLGWIPGRVLGFRNVRGGATLPMPHMGWNTINTVHAHAGEFFKVIDGSKFYFLHSFFFDATAREDVAATCNYGLPFDAVVSRGNVHGVQFHPEKSHRAGASLILRFLQAN
jgi:glutamine amidotransferase